MDKDGICEYCGRLTKTYAGNPSEWPLWFSLSDEPGVAKPHHTGCVVTRLHLAAIARDKIEGLIQTIQSLTKDVKSLQEVIQGLKERVDKL